ncbi:ExbD/TolR family protein [Roseibium sp.]|uniref:ExbD/TolR family protein n=1 Tax=Roseibium sp. TaxID=1936156 RepID=UPI003BB1603D
MILLPNPVARRKRIPLTPLIDVIFILIMFFLLSSTFGIWRPLEVLLGQPAGDNSALEAARPEIPSILIMVGAHGSSGDIQLTVNGKELMFEELAAELDRLAGKGATSALLVPESETDFQQVVRILDEARSSRLQRVSLHLR